MAGVAPLKKASGATTSAQTSVQALHLDQTVHNSKALSNDKIAKSSFGRPGKTDGVETTQTRTSEVGSSQLQKTTSSFAAKTQSHGNQISLVA
ncbi:hypothetical protein [Sulfitobacter sediminilitoris]